MKQALFKWGRISRRQKIILTWWTEDSLYKDYDGIIADGSIRSGKTVSMAFSFAVWAMENFNGQKFAMSGKTIGSLRRNCIGTMKRQLKARGYAVEEKRFDNLIIVSKGDVANEFYLFGGKDEASQDIVQGITLAGAFFDEVALMPESFVNQATARCSVDGSKWWFNCNPRGPQHWFYQKWIRKAKKRRLVYLHFTMDDNLTLTQRIRKRYMSQYVGVFFSRYIKGLWVMAEGLIYDMFNEKVHVLEKPPDTEGDYYISADYGIQNATVFLLWRKVKQKRRWCALREYYYSGRDKGKQKTVAELVDGMESILPEEDGKIIKPRLVIIDPSATALKVELRKRGYKVKAADNDVLDGIADVGSALQDMLIVFCKCCTNTVAEFGTYIWDHKAADRGEDKPVKVKDHGMDATRYFVRTQHLVKRKKAKQDEPLPLLMQ